MASNGPDYISVKSKAAAEELHRRGERHKPLLLPEMFGGRRHPERLGAGGGRIYNVVVEATDYAGNVTDKSVEITIPHDRSSHCVIADEVTDGKSCP
jgi:hypothetical protein